MIRTKMKNITIGLLLVLLSSSLISAQSADEESAIAVVNKLFAAMKAKDAEQIKAVFSPEGQLVAIDKPREGTGISKTRMLSGDAFATMISGNKGADYIEFMPSPEARVSGDLAVVSGRYTFHLGEKLSHCGMNTFNLVRTESGWRIANAASTLEFQCDRDLRAVAIPKVAADPKDVSTIDGIIKAFYETISGPKGQPRQWGRDRTLYMPGVRFVSMNERDGKISAGVMTHQQYVNGTNVSLVGSGFHESEINRIERRFGNIVHVFSVYEFTTDSKEKGRGINSIELYWDGTRWWISFAGWDEERPGNPIPKEFLSTKRS
ncbi:MAG TPA: nuclear transport factor 2 family protein [Pyrinomonadaceae bacterium]|nr:nuclear transport factor 2 family protein [Pyrinomonadaceae bacterium]